MMNILSPSNDAYTSNTTTVSKSISKFDIQNLENKIKMLEKQITNIQEKKKNFEESNSKNNNFSELLVNSFTE